MRRSRVMAVAGLALASAAALSGCAAGSPSASAATTAAVSVRPPAGSAAACVPDPQKVATSKDEQSSKAMPASLAARYNAAAEAAYEQVKSVAPSVIVGVRTPKGTWEKAFGTADLSTDAPSTTDMYQRIGSVTKTFVATAVLQLADEHKLSLDDPVDDYVAGVPNGTRITLRELVAMTSGLGNYTDNKQWYSDMLSQPHKQWTPQELLDVAYSMPTSFPPGTNMEYSNTNYILLGQVIQRVTGKPWEDAVKAQILGPLRMTSTILPTSDTMPSPHAHGYTHETNAIIGATPTEAWTDAPDYTPSWGGAAGGMISDLGDLFTWGRALATGQGVLPAAAQVKRLESFGSFGVPGLHQAGLIQFYGDGLMCRDGWIGHPGNITGYNTGVSYNPAIQTTIVTESTGDAAFLAVKPAGTAQDYLTSALAKVTGHPYPVSPAGTAVAPSSSASSQQ